MSIDPAPSDARRKKILMVYPAFPPSFWSFGYAKKIGGFKAVMPPLGLATLAAVTPRDYDVSIVDENVRPIDFDAECDIVALSAMAIQEKRFFEVADEFRRRGKLVAMGGPICNIIPEKCRPHCDILFEGEGEYTWPEFLSAWEKGQHRDHYAQVEMIDLADSPRPRIDLLDLRAYRVGCVQASRGCPFQCDFCDIIVTYGRKVRTKPIEHVIAELEAWSDAGVDFITMADDNLVGNRKYARQLLEAVADWNSSRDIPVALYVEMSVNSASDPELLEALRRANVVEAFLGLETPRASALREVGKTQNLKTSLIDAVKTIQSYGIVTVAGMIVGFDADDEEIFEEQYAFLHEAGVPIVMLGLLQAIPRTPLHTRLAKEGRLRSPVQGNNTRAHTNIVPLRMTYEQLVAGYQRLFCSLYEWDALARRWLDNVAQWSGERRFTQQPLGRWRPKLLMAALRLAIAYAATPERRRFAITVLWGTWRRAPRALLQSINYLAYFLHLREYAERVVANELAFNYVLPPAPAAEATPPALKPELGDAAPAGR